MRSAALIALALACRLPPGGAAPPGPIDPQLPQITALSWTCEDARFTLELTADQWTGGAELWLTVDGRYAERHPVPSIAAAPDGSLDELRVRLPSVADWRAARPGQSTAFDCADPITAGLVLRDWAGAIASCQDLQGERWRTIEGIPSDCADE